MRRGDYFGPLVVAAVRADEDMLARLEEWGAADSKTLTDGRALKLGAKLRDEVQYAVRRVDPNEYNALYPEYPALNPMLADLHAEVIDSWRGLENVLSTSSSAAGRQGRLEPLEIRLTEVPRASRPSPPPASSPGRSSCGPRRPLRGLRRAPAQGAGAPTDAVGRRLVVEQGEGGCAPPPSSFKNTGKILDRL